MNNETYKYNFHGHPDGMRPKLQNLYQNYSYPEWPHRQGGSLACSRLQGRFLAAPIYTMHEELRGYCP